MSKDHEERKAGRRESTRRMSDKLVGKATDIEIREYDRLLVKAKKDTEKRQGKRRSGKDRREKG
jgi:hypothetical protein